MGWECWAAREGLADRGPRLGMLLRSQLLAASPLAVRSCSLDTEPSFQAHDGNAGVCSSSLSDLLDPWCLSLSWEPPEDSILEHTEDSPRDDEFSGLSRIPF